jgi:kynureninase
MVNNQSSPYDTSLTYARKMDAADPLRKYRDQFYIPKVNRREAIYLCGNSLGLQPKTVEKHIMTELEDWRKYGVEGHIHARNPWLYYHHLFTDSLCKLTGAKPKEVVCMNNLTVNLNLMMLSFYQPRGRRVKIIMEGNAFPSDYYAVEQQMRLHGIEPSTDNIIELVPRAGETHLRTDDVLATIRQHSAETALVLIGAVNYYSGQYYDIPQIATICRTHGIAIGLDLAHAIGNVELYLHEWGVDFATWCSYKYLNSGPGGVSGVFVHERHGKNTKLPRLAGWWGNDEKTRFKMRKHFVPQEGAAGWQMSNAPVLNMAAHKASLAIFDQAGMPALRRKSLHLTGYLAYLIAQTIPTGKKSVTMITPTEPTARGCQMSLRTGRNGKKLFDYLTAHGVMADWREPDVIRIAPVPLYNSYVDVYKFIALLAEAIAAQ